MDSDKPSADAEKVKLLFEKIREENDNVYRETVAGLEGQAARSIRLQYYLKLGILVFFIGVFFLFVYFLVAWKEYDPENFLALGILAFIIYKVRSEVRKAGSHSTQITAEGIVTGKFEEYYDKTPLHYIVLSEKRRIRIPEDDYHQVTLGDRVTVSFVDADDPTLPISMKRLGSILEDSATDPSVRSAEQPPRRRQISLGRFVGRFALSVIVVNLVFLMVYGTWTSMKGGYVERYSTAYWILAALSLGVVGYLLVYPAVREIVHKKSTRLWAMVYFCVAALVSTTTLLLAMDYFLVKISTIESPEAFGPENTRYFMFRRYHLHRDLQYDSVYYRYDRSLRDPKDEFNYFAIVPLSASREDTVFSLLLYTDVVVSQKPGSREEIENGLSELFAKEHEKLKKFPFDSITYFNRSQRGTLTKETAGQLMGDRITDLPFHTSADAILLEPHTDNPVDEGPSYLLLYLVVLGLFLLFSIAITYEKRG